MTLAVLGFQLLILLSILFTRVLAKDKLELVCVGWTVFTFVMVFASPLILLQLVVVWGSYAMLSPDQKAAEPTPLRASPRPASRPSPSAPAPRPAVRAAPPSPRLAATPLITEAPNPSDPSSSELSWAETLAAGARHIQRRAHSLNDAVTVKAAVQKAIHAAERSVFPESSVLSAALKVARSEVEVDEFCSTPEKRREYEEICKAFLPNFADEAPSNGVTEPRPAATFELPARDADPRIAEGVQTGIKRLKEKHEQFLAETLAELQADPRA